MPSNLSKLYCPVDGKPYHPLNRLPRALECDHVICQECIINSTKNDSITCPTCFRSSNYSSIKDDVMTRDYCVKFFVDCFTCKTKPARYLDEYTFIAMCTSCTESVDVSGFRDLNVYLLEKEIHDELLKIYNSHKREFCPERRKIIRQEMTKTNNEMLKTYHWVKSYLSSICMCVFHP